MCILTGIATRRGTREYNADCAHVYQGSDGTTTAAVIDGTGNSAELAQLVSVVATVVARISYVRGGLAALLTAADLLIDHDDAAAVTVAVSPDGTVHTYWIGDCRAWWWDGNQLRQLTTDHTMGQLLRVSGGQAAEQIARSQDHWLRLGLAEATPASIAELRSLDARRTKLTAGHLLLLTTDGVHNQIDEATLGFLVAAYAAAPQSLADTLIASAAEADNGYRDDATAVVLTACPLAAG